MRGHGSEPNWSLATSDGATSFKLYGATVTAQHKHSHGWIESYTLKYNDGERPQPQSPQPQSSAPTERPTHTAPHDGHG